MKICMILTNNFDPDVRVYEEAKYLHRNGAQVEILRWDRSENFAGTQSDIVDGVTFTRFGCMSVAGSGMKQLPVFFRFIAKVRRYIRQHPFDYYHLHDLDGGIVGLFALPRKAKYVYDMHEFHESGGAAQRRVFRWIILRLIRKSVASLYENDKYLSGPYGKYRDKLYSLRNYPDEKLIQRKDKTPSDVFRVGYHGAVRSQIPQFAALFAAVRDMPDVRVDINGGGIDYEQLLAMAGAYDNVHVNGPYNGIKESTRLYQNTDVLFCGYDKHVPHHKDFDAVKFFEAIITATPMIMQCDISMGEKVVQNGYGLAVETDDAQAIRDAIIRLKTDKDLYQSFQQNEIRDAGLYCWQTEVSKLKAIYRL
ncbi:MAG: glycosyltransferase [Firmicutes bacterium]|nr:glycosyltransferase [Bacillota bacterium]